MPQITTAAKSSVLITKGGVEVRSHRRGLCDPASRASPRCPVGTRLLSRLGGAWHPDPVRAPAHWGGDAASQIFIERKPQDLFEIGMFGRQLVTFRSRSAHIGGFETPRPAGHQTRRWCAWDLRSLQQPGGTIVSIANRPMTGVLQRGTMLRTTEYTVLRLNIDVGAGNFLCYHRKACQT